MLGFRDKTAMIDAANALRGRTTEMPVGDRHAMLGTPMKPPFPAGLEQAVVGMGCFWRAERVLWQAPGVFSTAVGYAGGFTPNPTYEEVCSGRTGHTEAVLVVFDPARTSYEEILRLFWQNHEPTQGMRQGNDVGPAITTEIAPAGPFYYAEDYHQQYLHKNPWGYCGLGGTGVSCPVGLKA